MQWLNLPICSLFFNTFSLACGPHTSSIGVAAFGFLWYRSSHSDPWKIPQLQIWPHCWSATASLPSGVFFHFGEQKTVRLCQIRRIWRVINQFKATVTHSSHCTHRLMCRCPDETGLPLSVFRPFCIVYSTTLQSPVLLFQCGIIWKGNNAISVRKGWI